MRSGGSCQACAAWHVALRTAPALVAEPLINLVGASTPPSFRPPGKDPTAQRAGHAAAAFCCQPLAEELFNTPPGQCVARPVASFGVSQAMPARIQHPLGQRVGPAKTLESARGRSATNLPTCRALAWTKANRRSCHALIAWARLRNQNQGEKRKVITGHTQLCRPYARAYGLQPRETLEATVSRKARLAARSVASPHRALSHSQDKAWPSTRIAGTYLQRHSRGTVSGQPRQGMISRVVGLMRMPQSRSRDSKTTAERKAAGGAASTNHALSIQEKPCITRPARLTPRAGTSARQRQATAPWGYWPTAPPSASQTSSLERVPQCGIGKGTA